MTNNVVPFPSSGLEIFDFVPDEEDYTDGATLALSWINSIKQQETAAFLDGVLDTLADFMFEDE